ncbi:MAG TPA: hypothetical protein PLS84_00930, partial [Salinivirgaceae bacterium]|nr:hypothetical protein [Salinivirgaceae bacterium]
MKIKSLLKTLMTFIMLVTTAGIGLSQVSLLGTSYSETFDNISSGLPEGWTVRIGATDTTLGTTQTLSTSPTAWSQTTGAFKNFASADSLESNSDATAQSNSTDRALGVRQTGTFGDPGAAFVFQIANTEGLANFELEFKLQSLDIGPLRKTTWLVDYGFGSSPTEFTQIATLPSTLSTGNSSFTNTQVYVDFGSTLNNINDTVCIRIVTLSSTSGTGSRTSTGIDDFQLSWTVAPSSYSVNYSVVGTNGSLSAAVDSLNIISGSEIELNKNVVFTALPDSGYRVKEWKKNETIVAGNTTNIYTVENLSENINVTVEFELIPEYTLTINIVGNGSVTVNGSEYTAPMLFSEGSEVALSAVTNASWSFDGWTGGLVSTNSSETVTINSNITITATFIQLPETIVEWTFPDTVENRLASGGIAINLDREISREPEFTGTYSYITGDGTKALNSSKWEAGANSKYWIIDFATTGYENITLSSKQRGSNTGPRDFKVQVKLDGTEWIDVASSDIVVANNFTSGVLSDIALPEVCSNQGKVYMRWVMTSDTSVNGLTVASAGTNGIDNIVIKGDSMSLGIQHSLTLSSSGNGVTIPVSGIYTYNEGTNISIQAVPDLGWIFTGWSGDIVSTDNPVAVTMNSDKTVTAQFTEATNEYSVNFSVVGGNGSLTATVNGTTIVSGNTVSNGNNVIFNATPSAGYRVKEWTHNSVVVEHNTTNTFTLENLSADATVTVEFELIPIITYTVNFSVVGANGSLSATVDSLNIISGSEIEQNKNIVFTALPDSSYRVKEWKKNETIVAGNTTNIYTVENLSENIDVTVEFELIPEYTLTINIVGNGSVMVNGSEYTAPMLFSEGSEVALSAVTNASWSFDGWTGGLVSTNSSETVTINSNITITATFIQLPETI